MSVKFVIHFKYINLFVFIFNKFHKRWRNDKAPLKLHFYMYSKDRELYVVSALNEYLKRTKKMEKNWA